jgi:hypothetical protein
MLNPASGFFMPWHSKQYFWKVAGGVVEGRLRRDEGGSDLTARTDRGGPSGSADVTETTAEAMAMHNPRRFMALPG